MLTALSLENFRAFSKVDLEFSRLNILVGPNNSGKSSIISAINLISQNVRRGVQQFSIALNGPYTDLGTFYDTVFGHTARSSIGIKFSLDDFHYEYKYKYRTQRREIELIHHRVCHGGAEYTYTSNKDVAGVVFRNTPKSAAVPLERYRIRNYGMLLFGNPSFIQNVKDNPEVGTKFRELNFRSMSALERHFAAFDAVGAFRAPPQRTYHYTGEAPNTIGRFGENVAQILASNASRRLKSSARLMRRISGWFSNSGVASNVSINALTNRHFEITISDNTGATNNIIDSGFGCSQVLPVLAGGYNLVDGGQIARRPMYVVQEPEIHLHPTAAAHLGSYFVELANAGVQVFIETHSENLILRVARHIALGEIKRADVKIYWVSGATGRHEATPLILNEDGTFKKEWPEGFFPTRSDEVVELARAAARKKKLPTLKRVQTDD